ncbi:toxin S6C6 [Periplaneta americana]|uniref:toxin S6C6 n=1 Tax=Periplaneta americana TaxID=6978 RepID=UPI0037E774F5
MGLRCYQCGQYTDGVGSITPCINYTSDHLRDCPAELNNFCIKFVSEGSTVRECIDKCTEKETWGTRIYCCNEDGCNSSDNMTLSLTAWLCSIAVATLRQITSF